MQAEDIVTMDNGCVCCTVRGDLVKALLGFLDRRDTFDCILLETTGIADPSPIVATFNQVWFGFVCGTSCLFFLVYMYAAAAAAAHFLLDIYPSPFPARSHEHGIFSVGFILFVSYLHNTVKLSDSSLSKLLGDTSAKGKATRTKTHACRYMCMKLGLKRKKQTKKIQDENSCVQVCMKLGLCIATPPMIRMICAIPY